MLGAKQYFFVSPLRRRLKRKKENRGSSISRSSSSKNGRACGTSSGLAVAVVVDSL